MFDRQTVTHSHDRKRLEGPTEYLLILGGRRRTDKQIIGMISVTT